MLTLTAEILYTTPVALALDCAREELHRLVRLVRGLPEKTALELTDDDALTELGDKQVNILKSKIVAIADDADHGEDITYSFASPLGYEELCRVYKSKAKLVERRAALSAWFAIEGEQITKLWAACEELRAARAAAAPVTKRKPAVSITVTGSEAISKLHDALVASGDTETAAQVAAAPSGAVIVLASSSKLAKAVRPPRMPAERKGRAPTADRFTAMSVDELRVAAKEMFGVETQMNSVAHLRYRLRAGQRAIDAGQSPRWNPAETAVRVPADTVREVIALLGVGPELTDDEVKRIETVKSELSELLAKLSAPANETAEPSEGGSEAA